MFKKSALALALAATTLTGISATPAAARDNYRRGGGDDTAVAIGVGIIGLAIGAAIASSGNRDRRYDRYEGGYYRDGRYYNYNNGYYEQRRRHRGHDRGDYRYDRDGRYGYGNDYRGDYGY